MTIPGSAISLLLAGAATDPNLVEIYAWGGGGGSGYAGGSGAGGGGGAVYATAVLSPSQVYNVVVGGGGLTMAPNAGTGGTVSGGGGLAGTSGYGGQGGGYSGIFIGAAATQNAALVIAGGGGGGAYEGAAGGAGGGSTGAAGGSGAAAGGGGGTQSAGGTSSHSGVGTALKGGDCGTSGDGGGGGGGGGGYWGGGAGSGANPGSAGGGGSGYINTLQTLTGTLYAGSGATPGNSGSSFRGSYGNGGASGANNGLQGVVIIRYQGTPRYTGGTITQSGGYTTHTFTANGYLNLNTVLLMPFKTSATADHSPIPKTVTMNGTVTISSAQSKYYGASAYFSNGNWLSVAASNDFLFAANDFTMELWIYPTTNAYDIFGALGAKAALCLVIGNSFGFSPAASTITFGDDGSGGIVVNYPNQNFVGGPMVVNQWQHLAFVRSGTSFLIFRDGQLLSTTTVSSSNNNVGSSSLAMGIGRLTGSINRPVTGYIQDLAIYKGYAKYTGTFTPPGPLT
jgi:hypothetical protein